MCSVCSKMYHANKSPTSFGKGLLKTLLQYLDTTLGFGKIESTLLKNTGNAVLYEMGNRELENRCYWLLCCHLDFCPPKPESLSSI